MNSDTNVVSSQSKENHAARLNKAVEDQENLKEQSGEKRKIDIEKPNWNIIESANFLSPRKSVTKVTKLVLNTKTSTNHNDSAKTKQTQLKKDTKSASTKSLLSVNDQTAKHSNGDKCNDGKTNNNNNLKVEEFKMKKQDRERLSNEFKECLVENFNKVNSPRPSTVVNNNNNQVMEPPKVVKNVAPSPKKLNSPNDIKVTLPCKKSKNYDPEEAREYIKEQQKKWKIGNEQSKVENKYEKEEIRKRLKDLQERTSKIVQTNLQKSKRLRSVEKPHNSLGILRRPNLTPPDKKQPLSSTSSVNSFVNSKSDDKSSFSATPKSSNSVSSEPRALLFETPGAHKEVPPSVKKSDQIKIEDVPENDDHLKVPHIKLIPNHKSETTSQSSDVSFWLRPSGVQTYPYNFIMAIRKKLEAISEPKINNHKNTTNTTRPSPESSSIKLSSSQTNQSSNTVSDISSIRSEPLKSQNIFTSTHIENKNNESCNNNSTLKSTIISEEIPEIIPLSKEKIQNMKIAASESSNKKDLSNAEFYKLLESFNKSLSHVIEVNQQLYSSLKNPPESFVNFKRGSVANDQITHRVDESKKTEVEYSENFDQIPETIEPHDDIEETTIVPILNLNSSSRTSVSNSDNTTTLKAFTENNKNESSPADINNTTLGSEIFSYFKDLNDTDLENSMINYSEVNLNYSTIGIYDKMIRNEQSKSEHLASLMKMREKSLIDRARGQIAWLEIQKQKFKEAGKREEISSIKKKQRALLMRLDKERANIQRVVKEKGLFQNEKSSVVSLKYKELHSSSSSISIRKRSKSVSSNDNSALKVYDLEGGANLSNLLQQREIELTKRRENVERLLEWHRRLDKEEKHVVEMERQLYQFNLNKINHQQNVTSLSNNNNTSNNIKKIKKINRSLKILKNIPSSKGNTSTSEDVLNDESDNVVDITGAKLNKLWYRLTGHKDRKYDEKQIYNITKTELEKMYVEAKRVVLEEGQILNLIDSSRLDLSHGTNTEIETEPEMKNEEEEEIHELTIKSEDHDVAETTTDFKIETTHIAETHIELEENTTIEQPPISEIINSKDSTFTVMHDLEILNSETESEPIGSVLNLLDLNTTVPSFLEDVSFPNFNDISSAIINLNGNDADDDAAVDNETDNRNSSPKNDKTYDYDSSFDDNTSKLIEEEVENFYISNESSLRSVHENEIETRLIRLDSGLKELSRSFEKIPAELKSPELLSPRSQSRSSSEEKEMIKSEVSLTVAESVTSSSDDPSTEQERMDSPILMRNKNINETFPNTSSQPVLITMPDIISEAEVLRRQQNIQILDNEKPATPPFLYLREIPNKPPPPYVPPAHGSQFTSVFPTEDRIIEIVMRRTKELYDIEFHGQMEPDNSIIHENITNVYERIILDVCRELIHDFKVPEPTNTYEQIESFHKNKLSLYNPPNRLHTIQSQVLKKIRRLLYVESQGIRPQTYTFVQGTNKRKRDLVDEILSHELNEEEIKWTNFDVEEMEVKNKVTCELVQILIDEALNDFEEIYEKQL